MKFFPLVLLFLSFFFSFISPQSPGVQLAWGITILAIFLLHMRIYISLPLFFFVHLFFVFFLLFFHFRPLYLTFTVFFASYLIFWFLAVYSFSSSTPFLFVITVLLNILFLQFFGNQTILWYILVIEGLFFYLFLKHREHDSPSTVYLVFFTGLFFLGSILLDLHSPGNITQESFLYFALWLSLQLPVALKVADKNFIVLRVFLLSGIILFWNSPLYEEPLFWFFLLLVHYPRPSLPKHIRSRTFLPKTCCIIILTLVLYFNVGYFLNKMYLRSIAPPEENFKFHFYMGRIFSYLNHEHYEYWIHEARDYALEHDDEEYRQLTMFFQRRLLNLEPTEDNYLQAARTAADLNNYNRASQFYKKALLRSFFRKDILKEFLVFLNIHSDFEGAEELQKSLINYGYRLYPEDPYFLEQMIKLRRGRST